jgi:hypothetical protein
MEQKLLFNGDEDWLSINWEALKKTLTPILRAVGEPEPAPVVLTGKIDSIIQQGFVWV